MSQFDSEPQLYRLYSELSEFEENPATINEQLESREIETIVNNFIDSFSNNNNGDGDLDKNNISKRSNNVGPLNTSRLVSDQSDTDTEVTANPEAGEGSGDTSYGPMEGVQIIKAIGTIYEPESGSDWMIPDSKDSEGSVILSTGSLLDLTGQNGTTEYGPPPAVGSELGINDTPPEPETSSRLEQLNDGDGKPDRGNGKWNEKHTTWSEKKPNGNGNSNSESVIKGWGNSRLEKLTNGNAGGWGEQLANGDWSEKLAGEHSHSERVTSDNGNGGSKGSSSSKSHSHAHSDRLTSGSSSGGSRGSSNRHIHSERVTIVRNNGNGNGHNHNEKLTNGNGNGNSHSEKSTNANGNLYSAKLTNGNGGNRGNSHGNGGSRSEKQTNGNAVSWTYSSTGERSTNGWKNGNGASQRQNNGNGVQRQTSSNGYNYPEKKPNGNGNGNGSPEKPSNGNGNGSPEKPSNGNGNGNGGSNGKGNGYPDRQPNGNGNKNGNGNGGNGNGNGGGGNGNKNGNGSPEKPSNGNGYNYPKPNGNGNGNGNTNGSPERQTNGNGRGYSSPERLTARNSHPEKQTTTNSGTHSEKLANGNSGVWGNTNGGNKVERQAVQLPRPTNPAPESTSTQTQKAIPPAPTVPQNQNTIRNLLFGNPSNVQIETKSTEGVGPGISDIVLQSNFIGSSSNIVSSISLPFRFDDDASGTQQPIPVNKINPEVISSNQIPYPAASENSPLVIYSLHSDIGRNTDSETILPPSSAIYSYNTK